MRDERPALDTGSVIAAARLCSNIRRRWVGIEAGFSPYPTYGSSVTQKRSKPHLRANLTFSRFVLFRDSDFRRSVRYSRVLQGFVPAMVESIRILKAMRDFRSQLVKTGFA
ncbi:hypothetical protein WBP07_26350 [Novosphingobium sp. BL-8A]